MGRLTQRAWGRLTYHLRKAMNEVGWANRYDPDYVLGAIMEWLEKENMVLTGSGLKYLRK